MGIVLSGPQGTGNYIVNNTCISFNGVKEKLSVIVKSNSKYCRELIIYERTLFIE